MDCIELRKRFDAVKTDRHNIEGTWELIDKFIVPYRGMFFQSNTGETEVDWRKREIYDSTAIIANQNLAANIHSNITNPIIKWFDIKFRNNRANMMYEAKRWLEEVGDLIYLALQESNFNLEVNEAYLDLTAFGTACFAEEVEENPDQTFKALKFEALPIFQSYYELDTDGRVINYYRQLSWTPQKILDKFGADGCPDFIKDKASLSTSGTERVEVIFAVYKRDLGPEEEPDTFNQLIPTERPYGYKYFVYPQAEMLGDEGGYYEMPIFNPKWRKVAGSDWGHSPGMVCLSDVLTLNQLVELILRSAEKVVDPPILTTRRGVFGDVDLEPGGVTVTANPDAVKPFESRARFDVSHLQKQQLQDSINRTYFMDQLQLKESPAMTATEVNARFQLMQRLLGPTLGRLQSDFLDPLIERTFKVLYRYRMLPPIPEVLLQSGAELEIEYLGTMARAQKYDEVAATERWLANIAAMAELYPGSTDIVNVDTTTRDMGLAMGVPTRNMNSQQQIEDTRAARQQEQETAKNLALMDQAANIAKTAGEANQTLQ